MRNYSIRYDYVLPIQSKLPFSLAYPFANLTSLRAAKKDPMALNAAHQAEKTLDNPNFNPQAFIKAYCQMVEYDRLDSFMMPRLTTPRNIQSLIQVSGIEKVNKLKRAGRKIILTSGHFGRFWMNGPILRLNNHTVSTLTRDGGDENTHQLHPAEFRYRKMKLDNIQKVLGGPFLVEGGNIKPLYHALKEHIVVLLFDVPYADLSVVKTVQVNFLNQKIHVPIGLYRIALKSKAAVVPYFAVAGKRGRVHIEYADIYEAKDYSAEDFMQAMATLLEQQILKNPSQWWLWSSLPDMQVKK